MGFYSSSRLYQESFSDVPEVTLEQVIQDPNIQPTEQEDLIEASLNIIENIQENQNRFFQHIGIAELDYMEANGEEMIYTEGVLGDIVSTIKSFLMKIWERIKALFKRFIMILDSYSKNDKDFAKKYQKEIFGKSGDTSDFSFKGYKWKIETSTVTGLIGECDKKAQEKIAWVKDDQKTTGYMGKSTDDTQKRLENINDEIEKMRGDILKGKIGGNGGSMTEEEFRKELHEYFRGGETEKEELEGKDIDVHDMYNHLITSNQDRKDVDKVFKENKKSIDQTEKDLLRLQNEYAKEAHTYDDSKVQDLSNPKSGKFKFSEIDDDEFSASTTPWLWNHPDSIKDIYTKKVYNNAGKNGIPAVSELVDPNNVDKDDNPEDFKKAILLIKKYSPNQATSINSSYYKTTARDKGNRYSKALSIAMRIVGASKSALIAIDSEYLNAMKERSRQYKACLIAYVHYRPSGESAMHEQNVYSEAAYSRFSSPLKGINLF